MRTSTALLVSASILSSAQTLPVVHGTSVSGHSVTLPDQARGKVAVLVIGFSRNSAIPTGVWGQRLKAEFGRDPGVSIFRMPFLEEVPRLFRGMAIAGVKHAAGSEDRDTMVMVFESEAVFKHLAGYAKPDDAYIVVLDAKGAIQRRSTGDAQIEFAGVRDQIKQLLRGHPDSAAR